MSNKGSTRITRSPQRRWVRVNDIQVYPPSQRRLDAQWVTEKKAMGLDVDLLGLPVLNLMADGRYFAIDGQHRAALLRAVGWGDQLIECEVYEGLSYSEMARLFRRLNKNRKAIKTLDDFLVGVTAGDDVPVGVNRIVRAAGLMIDHSRRDGTVQAVAAMSRIYAGARLGPKAEKDGPDALGRTLATIKNAWGDDAQHFVGPVVEGIGYVQLRYNGTLEQPALARKLSTESGGAAGVLSRAKSMRDTMGGTLSRAVAGVVVEIYNRGRRTGKIESWWK